MSTTTRRICIDVLPDGVVLTVEHAEGTWMQIRDKALDGIIAQCNALRNAEAQRREEAAKEAAKIVQAGAAKNEA